MKDYTEKNPVFSDTIKITDTTDPGNANLLNEPIKQLLQNELVLHKRMNQYLGSDPKQGDSQNQIVIFDSDDNAPANEWTDVAAMKSGETHKSLFGKVSTMFKNVRYLYKLLGTTDISSIGDGTITDIIKTLSERNEFTDENKKKLNGIDDNANNYTHPSKHGASMITQDATHRFVSDAEKTTWNNKLNKADVTQSAAVTVTGQKALDAVEKNAAVPGTMAYDLAQINSNLAWQNIDFSTWNARSGMEWVGKYCPATREVRIMFTYNNSSGLENGLTYLNIPDGFRPIGGWQLIGIDIVVHGTYANGAFTKDAVSFPVFVRYLGDGRVEINYAINEPAQRHAGIIMYNY